MPHDAHKRPTIDERLRDGVTYQTGCVRRLKRLKTLNTKFSTLFVCVKCCV